MYDVLDASREIERVAVTAAAPSDAEVRVTRTLRETTKIPQIVLDRVRGDAKSDPQGRGFFSFKEAGHR